MSCNLWLIIPSLTVSSKLANSASLVGNIYFKKQTSKEETHVVRQWLARRPGLGQYARLMKELENEDSRGFRKFLRMDYEINSDHRIHAQEVKVQRTSLTWHQVGNNVEVTTL